jgi:integrase
LLDKEKGRGDAKVRYRIKYNGNIIAFNLGYRVDIDKWSIETQRCKNNTTHGKNKIAASIINKEIHRFEDAAENIFSTYEKSNKIPTPEEFRREFNILNGREVTKKSFFFDVFDEFTCEMGNKNQWTKATYQKFAAIKNHLFNFSDKLEFSDFNEKGLNDFISYLRDIVNMRNSTISKQIGYLKWFLRWSDRKGYNNERAYLTFSPRLKIADKKVIFLDWDELITVYEFELPTQRLREVRDVFCFCCFTGLRYSDVANLKRSSVFDTHLSITTIKTIDSIKIELNDFSKEILKRYSNTAFPNNLALPIISNQKMNEAIKEIMKMCEIDKPTTITYFKGNDRKEYIYPKYELIGTHTARRTFICNALMLGIPAHVVMKWTGHKDYKAMRPYIDIADRAKEQAMSLFNKKTGTKKGII